VGLFAASSVSVQTDVHSPRPIRAFALPNLTGLTACHARRIVLGAGLKLQTRIPRSRCFDIVVAQSPGPHTMIAVPKRDHVTVTLRLRPGR